MGITVKQVVAAADVTVLSLTSGGNVAAQSTAGHAHIGHVTDGFRDTPDGQGLLTTAMAEAEIAARHAGLSAMSMEDVTAMKRHAGHVLHALDPAEMSAGPGLGYGVKTAASGVVRHIQLTAATEGASQNIVTHSTHVATAATNVVEWADEAIALAKQIQAEADPAEAWAQARQLNKLASELTLGVDANGDGNIGWGEGEGGLQQAEQHASLMKKGEGLP